jgi:hypothetical protein
MRCTCDADESPHHHAFGGTFACQGHPSCKRCQTEDELLWRDELNPTPKARVVRPARSQAGFESTRRRYGHQTAAILYGRSQRPETD